MQMRVDNQIPIRQLLVISIALFALKIALCYYLSHLSGCADGERRLSSVAFASGDTHSYTGAMENYITTGTYFFNNGKENVYAGRLPHSSLPYLVFRQFTGKQQAMTLVVLFQVFMEVVGILALSLAGLYLMGKAAFYIMLVLLSASLNSPAFTYYLSPESLSISTLCLFLFFYVRYYKTRTTSQLLLAGVFLAWLVTLKAYYIALYFPLGIEFIMKARNESFRSMLMSVVRSTVIVSVPLVVFLSPWVVRNYAMYNRFIPLQVNTSAGYDFSDAYFAYRRFVSSWGGDIIHWQKSSAGCYFIRQEGIPCEFVLPDYVFSENVTPDKIERVRARYLALQAEYNPAEEESIVRTFDSLTEDFIRDKPIRYHFISPLILAVKFLGHSGSYYLPVHASNPCYHPMQMVLKVSTSALYWLSIILGIPFLVVLSYRHKLLLPALIPLYVIFLFPIVFRVAEWRYLRTAEPVLYLGICHILLMTFDWWKKRPHRLQS